MLCYGKNVLLMTDPKKIKKVYINKNKKDEEVFKYLKENKIHYVLTDLNILNKMTSQNHQGVIIEIEEYAYFDLESILKEDFIIMLDHLEDPHNFGAIIRTCEAAGIKGIIIPKDRSVSVNDTVIKTSVGTIHNVKIVKVTNLVDTINTLKKNDYFIYGSVLNGKNFNEISYAQKKVLIIGNEGKGISNLVMKNCDELIKIPMKGNVNSLNASVATGIMIFKIGGIT